MIKESYYYYYYYYYYYLSPVRRVSPFRSQLECVPTL